MVITITLDMPDALMPLWPSVCSSSSLAAYARFAKKCLVRNLNKYKCKLTATTSDLMSLTPTTHHNNQESSSPSQFKCQSSHNQNNNSHNMRLLCQMSSFRVTTRSKCDLALYKKTYCF